MNPITRTLNVDNLLLLALQEDISSEDVTTNAVMPKACQGTVQLLCKQDGVIAGMEVFARVFTLLDEQTEMIPYVKDGDEVKKGDLLATVNGDIRVLSTGEEPRDNIMNRAQLSAADERNRNVYEKRCEAARRFQNNPSRHQKNNPEYAYF